MDEVMNFVILLPFIIFSIFSSYYFYLGVFTIFYIFFFFFLGGGVSLVHIAYNLGSSPKH